MKICGISDIHGNLYNGIPECDVLCICGDIVPLNEQRSMDASATWWTRRFTKWANELPCKKIIVVPGNHDFYLEKLYNEGAWEEAKEVMREMTNNKVEMLIDESYIYNSITFYGTPWIESIMFQEGRWAFELPKAKIDEHIYNKIPKCDVLITHDNPNYNHILDYYVSGKANTHLFGHWHDGLAYKSWGQYNCSILNDNYDFKKDLEIVTLDIMTEEERNVIEQDFLNILINQATSEEVLSFLKQFSTITSNKEDEVEWNRNINSEFLYKETDEELEEAA